MTKLYEYDTVTLVANVENVPKGSKGTIVMVHDIEKQIFEVEFFDDNAETLNILTVSGHFLSKDNRC